MVAPVDRSLVVWVSPFSTRNRRGLLMVSQRRAAVISFALATATIAACAKKAPPAPTPTPAPAIDSAAIRDSIERARQTRMRQDSINQAESMRRRQQQVQDSIANANRMAAEAAERDA